MNSEARSPMRRTAGSGSEPRDGLSWSEIEEAGRAARADFERRHLDGLRRLAELSPDAWADALIVLGSSSGDASPTCSQNA